MARPHDQRAGGPTVRSAPDPFSQFAANVEGYTRDRAHQGMESIRHAASAPADLSDAFSVFGVTPRLAKEVGGAVGVLTSPGGGVGDAVGTSMWNNPGDPRGRRLGDLAQALTPIGPGKVVEGLADAAKLTRGAGNALMRPYFARRTAQMAEEAASPSFAPVSRASSPNVRSTVTPHQQAAAAWEKVDDLHQRGETDPAMLMAASNTAVQASKQLGVPIQGTARDMVSVHLEPAANDKFPVQAPSRADQLPQDSRVVFDARDGKVHGIFPHDDAAMAYIDAHPDGNHMDFDSPANIEKNYPGPRKPRPYDPNNDPTRDADLEDELDDHAAHGHDLTGRGWQVGEEEPAWDYTGGGEGRPHAP